jgi:hypothetical protein
MAFVEMGLTIVERAKRERRLVNVVLSGAEFKRGKCLSWLIKDEKAMYSVCGRAAVTMRVYNHCKVPLLSLGMCERQHTL